MKHRTEITKTEFDKLTSICGGFLANEHEGGSYKFIDGSLICYSDDEYWIDFCVCDGFPEEDILCSSCSKETYGFYEWQLRLAEYIRYLRNGVGCYGVLLDSVRHAEANAKLVDEVVVARA